MTSIFNSFKEAICEKVHNLGSDTLKYALTNTAPVASNAVLADITQISAAGGYAPVTVSVTSSAQSGGVYSLSLASASFSASGASFDAFRYIVLYNDTAATDELIGWIDLGAPYTLTSGNSFVVGAGEFFTLG